MTATTEEMAIEDRAARGTLLVADEIVTLGHGRYRARAVLVRGKRVVWVGDDPASAPPHGNVVDLSGCSVGPAFVDAHVHLTPTGLTLAGLDLTGVASGRDMLSAVRTYAQQHTGRVVWGHGYDEHAFVDGLPTPDELSDAAPGMAVYLSRIDGHSSLIDRATLSAAPLARAGGIDRDNEGNPTGIVRREANHIVRRWSVGAMTAEELGEARDRVTRHAASLGIGSVHEMNGPDIMGVDDFEAWRTGHFPVEVVPYWGGLDLRFAAERDLKQIGGDLFLDGSLGSRTAALSAPYSDRPDESGSLEYDDDTLIDLFLQATQTGVQVGVHAIGDAAIEQAIRCWRVVDEQLPEYVAGGIRRVRPRLEHAEVLRPEQLDQIAELGLLVSAQPAFEMLWGEPGGVYRARLGEERAARTNPFRGLADRGVPLAFGSDANVTPMDPWGTVHHAEHRSRDEHSLTRLEAISAASLGGRYAARQDRYVGVVRAGMRADLSVWQGHPYRAEDPRGTRCEATIVRGRTTHGSLPGLGHWDEVPGERGAADSPSDPRSEGTV